MNETEASAQVKEAEERQRLKVRVATLTDQVDYLKGELFRQLKDFETLLEYFNLRFDDVPARRALVTRPTGWVVMGGGGGGGGSSGRGSSPYDRGPGC